MTNRIMIRGLQVLMLGTSLFMTSCKKDNNNQPSGSGNSVNAPQKAVPAAMVGRWVFTEISGSTINYPDGRTESTWGRGIAFDIKADGSGICVISAETHGPASESVSRVDDDCTFDIAVNGVQVAFKCYTIRGKVYENNAFLHDLDASKCYPATYWNWALTLGENTNGKYFEVDGMRYYKR